MTKPEIMTVSLRKSLLILAVKEESVSTGVLNCMDGRVTLNREGESQKPCLCTGKLRVAYAGQVTLIVSFRSRSSLCLI